MGSPRRIFIIVRAPNGDVREVPIGETAVVIGRDESADIRVEDKKVSRRHAAFRLIEGEPWVEDLGSANGVKLNGKRIDKRAKITAQDTVKVGGYRVLLKDLTESTGSSQMDDSRAERVRGIVRDTRPAVARASTPIRPPPEGSRAGPRPPNRTDDGRSPVLVAIDEPVRGQRFVIRPGENIIGRLEECDVPVLDGSVSRQHARVVFSRDRLSVTDLGASNGTFVNDARVEMAELANGDVLRVGNIRFKLELPPELSKQLSTPKTRARQVKKPSPRPWAMAGIVILLFAIAVLSATIYWKWRSHRDQRLSDVASRPIEEDGGLAEVVTAAQLPSDAAAARPEPTDAGPEADAGSKTTVALVPTEVKPDGFGSPSGRGGRALPDQGPAGPDAGRKEETQLTAIAVRPSKTATAPYGLRGSDGLPLNLPEVDATFDFDAFVEEKVSTAEQFEKDADYRRVRTVINELLARDPINAKGREIQERLDVQETAVQAFSQAEKMEQKGNLSKALKLYSAVPENAAEAPRAKAKIEELRPKAIEQELNRVEKDIKSKATWLRAHKRLKDVLELDPESMLANKAIRALEKKMRAKNMRFTAYIPPNAKEQMIKESPQDIDDAIAKRYPNEGELAQVARLYAQGALSKALKKAEALEKRSDGTKREDAKKVKVALKQIQTSYERIRNEISNNPNEAWAKLKDLESIESNILPGEVKSYVRKELEESIAEAFAEVGASQLERNRFEEAFVSWSAGYRLDPGNPKLLAGLRKLEERAKKFADEAELAGQRGEKGLCDRWRSITRMTRPESDVYKKAYERAKQICPA